MSVATAAGPLGSVDDVVDLGGLDDKQMHAHMCSKHALAMNKQLCEGNDLMYTDDLSRLKSTDPGAHDEVAPAGHEDATKPLAGKAKDVTGARVVLVAEDGQAFGVENSGTSVLLTEMLMDVAELPLRVPTSFSPDTVRRVVAVMNETLNVRTLDLWPQLTSSEQDELVAAAEFFMLKNTLAVPMPVLELQLPGGRGFSLAAYSTQLRHNLGLTCKLDRGPECPDFNFFDMRENDDDEIFHCASCMEQNSY